MAGLGQRFANEGYTTTKPMLPVSGKAMVTQAVHDLPPAQHQVFVLRTYMPGYQAIVNELSHAYPHTTIKTIDHVTEGQAITALIGIDALRDTLGNIPEPITIGACDNGALYRPELLQQLIDDTNIDVIVWGVRGYPNAIRNPHMFGWIDADSNGLIRAISVKAPLQNPAIDPIIL